MADPHETGPSSDSVEKTEKLATPLSVDDAPDCSRCKVFGWAVAYLAEMDLHDQGQQESQVGPVDSRVDPSCDFNINKDERQALRKALTNSPDDDAFSFAMQRYRVCPVTRTEKENINTLLVLVPPGACVSFDQRYRPGIHLDRQ